MIEWSFSQTKQPDEEQPSAAEDILEVDCHVFRFTAELLPGLK